MTTEERREDLGPPTFGPQADRGATPGHPPEAEPGAFQRPLDLGPEHARERLVPQPPDPRPERDPGVFQPPLEGASSSSSSEVTQALRPQPQTAAPQAPERPLGSMGRLMVIALLVLGIIGGGIVGSLTTLALTGGRVASVVQSGNQLPRATVDGAQTTAARPGDNSFANVSAVARAVTPAVVTVRTREGATPVPTAEGEGSGFIIDDEGHILTNNHVVGDASRITIILADGTRASATVVGTDPNSDLAVLKADLPPGKGAVAVLGDSATVQAGDLAIAIGAPFGLDHSVTAGIVSAVNRDWGRASGRLRGLVQSGLIQTDAPVNPGNSGGPLLNAAGEVIGINTAIEGPIRGSVGVGFAIPVNVAKQTLPQLLTGKKVEHPWLGISGAGITSDLAQDLNLPVNEGVVVFEVVADSPAAKAGLRGGRAEQQGAPPVGGDIITRVDGRPVKTVQEIASYLDTKRVGDTVTVTILRDGKPREVTVTLGAWPDNLNS
ncbi:MAG: trypsin-like peptidase domain-containing protein [Chloroflexi bacterium]|nr:trypsin-like peptidase domain-containing protein [Chloroflexota bacterium]